MIRTTIFVALVETEIRADLQMLQPAKHIQTGHKSQKYSLSVLIPNLLLATKTQPQKEPQSVLRGTNNSASVLCCSVVALMLALILTYTNQDQVDGCVTRVRLGSVIALRRLDWEAAPPLTLPPPPPPN